ncbi:MAG: c-type cytochrome [Candidatus Acidiferrales bacterium]
MVNAMRCARAALFLMLFVAVSGYALSAINCDTAVNNASPHFSRVITSISGQEEYTAFCAGCHGQKGRGKGRSSRYCTVPPADLTHLAQKNHGSYPTEKVCEVLRRGTGQPPKGQGYMPIWEPLLKSMNADPPGVTEVRIQNLVKYVKTLQDEPSVSKKRPAPAK